MRDHRCSRRPAPTVEPAARCPVAIPQPIPQIPHKPAGHPHPPSPSPAGKRDLKPPGRCVSPGGFLFFSLPRQAS